MGPDLAKAKVWNLIKEVPELELTKEVKDPKELVEVKYLRVPVLELTKDKGLGVLLGWEMVTKVLTAQLAEPIRDKELGVREVTLERVLDMQVQALKVQMLEQTKESVEPIKDKEVRVALIIRVEARILKVLEPEQVRDLMVRVVRALMVLVTDHTGVVQRFQEVRTPLPALVRKSPDVVTVTRTALDSASPVTVTVSPSTVSSPGWWQF